MPRTGTLPSDIAEFLRGKRAGATIEQIADAMSSVRRSPVLRPSVRSAIYQHLDSQGSQLFVRIGRGRYGLQK